AKSDGTTDAFSADRGSQTFGNQDAGLWLPGKIVARVWNDKDGDGKQDNNEGGANVEGISVELLDVNNGNAVIGSAETMSNGIATIYDVPTDRPVRLRFTEDANTKFTGRNKTNDNEDSDAKSDGTTDAFSADRGSQTFSNQDAGVWKLGTIFARVWIDLDGDGKQDNNEGGSNFEDATVRLLDAANGNALLGEGTTGPNGVATIGNVPSDRSVRLEFVLPNGYTFTGRNKTNDNEDSDAKGNGTTDAFSANRGSQQFTMIDAGLIPVAPQIRKAATEEVAQTEEPLFYPNPAQDQAFLKNATGYTQLSILDMKGSLVQVMDLDGETELVKLDLSRLPKGLYLIRLTGNQGAHVQRFVRE
ncbi:MAG: SdrD B-like domain-containing protein, partial [Bacteroidota bacterium]